MVQILLSLCLLAAAIRNTQAQAAAVNIQVAFDKEQDIPLFKKYAVMNSGLIPSSRYNDSIISSFGLIRASAFVTDLYMGTSNQNASFGNAITGELASAASNGFVYNFDELDHITTGLAAVGVTPYWAVTYAPTPFQPATVSDNTTQLAQCLGFEDVPGKYQCRPAAGVGGSASGFADCWKCPPKDATGGGYTQYGDMLKVLAQHEAFKLNVTVIKQIWNEPDLTSYFNYSAGGTTFFAGTNADYNAMYKSASTAMVEVDPDVIVGGPGLAYWLQTNPQQFPNDQRVSGTYFAQQVANSSLRLDFFSFHAIAACTDSAACNIANNGGEQTFTYRSSVARYALTDPPAGVDFNTNSFNTTQIHCTEYFAGTTAEQYALPYTASTDLSVLMLNNFLSFLDQTDVTQITWAQYMDITCCNGTGLLDFYGNARPAWHSFKFWGDIPTERVRANISDPKILAVAGYSPRTCHGGIILWNNATVPYTSTLNISALPYNNFTVQVYVLDDNHLPGPGYELDPFVTYSQQSAPGGIWNFPPAGETPFVLLDGAVVYLNITANDCQQANPVPNGRVLKTHNYYSKRPYQTYMYGEFDKLKWSAFIGMGNETQGTALSGAIVMVDPATVFNITMTFFGLAPPPATPNIGVRIDFWDPTTNSYPANSSIFFYQTGTSPAMQTPQLYGSRQDVPASNFYYVDLANFLFNPTDPGYPVPTGWAGKLSFIFMLQNAPLFSGAQAYITQQPTNPAAVAAIRTGTGTPTAVATTAGR